MNILIVSGSPRTKSLTVRVAQFLEKYFKANCKHSVSLLDVRDKPLPMIQKVWQSVDDAPENFQDIAEQVFKADAFILVSPEYNGSYSPALKNLLDHFPKQKRKPFGIVTASPGSMAGMRASQQMQQLICALFGIPSPHMLMVGGIDQKFNEKAELIDDSFLPNVETFVKEYLWLAEKLVA